MNFTRESIFVSAIRKFCNTFAVVLGFCVAVVAIVLGLSALSDNISLPNRGDLTVSADANWNRKLLPSTTPVLLRMELHGVIGVGNLTEEKFRKMLLDSREGSLAGSRVKGLLLHINTPGGTVRDSGGIYRALKEYKERYKTPVYAYVDGLCASGGMYIASIADQIFASSDSIIGSVGVKMGPAFNFSDVMDKIGIASVTLTEGKDKDTLNPFRPWKEDESASIQAILADSYEEFLDIVTAGRKQMSREKLVNDYGAQVFSAEKSQEYGYIDHADATYNDALKSLVQAVGIEDDGSYQVLAIEPYHSALQDLTQSQFFTKKVEHILPIGTNLTTELSGKLLYLYQP